jgi:LmbE family N-acetylglucosaminyl deacetylase
LKLFLSPHFDDVADSCGGAIYTFQHAGDDLQVITVMAGDLPNPLPDTPIVNDLHQRWQAGHDPIATRKQEDQAAMQALGDVSFRYLPVGDCVYRVHDGIALYPTEESLWVNVQPADPALETLNNLSLQRLSSSASDVEIYAPMGIGDHVDHLIVRDWAYSLADTYPGVTLYFYADFPYIRDREAIAAALSQHRRLKPETVVFGEAAMIARIAAMRCYRSQVSTFWPDEEAMEAEVRTTFLDEAHPGQYTERYWRYIAG